MRILGKKFGLFFKRAGAYVSLGNSTGCSLNVNADVVEVASASKSAKAFTTGRYQYDLTVDRLYGGGDMERWLLGMMTQGTALPFIIGGGKVDDDGEFATNIKAGDICISGEALVVGYSMGAPVEGYVTASVSLQGTGELMITNYE
jgi:predicted secreted protein